MPRQASTGKRTVAALLVCAGALTGCQVGAEAKTAVFCVPMPAVAAHRGGTEKSMENTVGSFTSAGAAGVRTWELDVRFDVKGVPVVLHDDTVDRVSGKSGPIARLDTSDHGVPTDDGQYVPTLREIYVLAQKYGAHVLTEFKVMPTESQWTAVTADIDDTIGRPAVTLMSFEKPIVAQQKKRFPGVETGLLHGAGDLGADEVHVYGGSLMQQQGSISVSRATTWHAAGLKLYAWTVDEPADWKKLSAVPVDVIITNDPIAYQQWADRQCRPEAPAK